MQKDTNARSEPVSWCPVENSAEVLSRLKEFAADGYSPSPRAKAIYYFLPLDQLPWPAGDDPSWRMNDVPEFFVRLHSSLQHPDCTPDEILFASTKRHGEVVIVPLSYLKLADIPLD